MVATPGRSMWGGGLSPAGLGLPQRLFAGVGTAASALRWISGTSDDLREARPAPRDKALYVGLGESDRAEGVRRASEVTPARRGASPPHDYRRPPPHIGPAVSARSVTPGRRCCRSPRAGT